MGFQTLFVATQFYAMARDMTKLVFYREFFFFFLRAPLLVWATIEYGLMGAVYACAATGVVHAILNLTLYARVSSGGFFDPLWAARRSLAADSIDVGLLPSIFRPSHLRFIDEAPSAHPACSQMLQLAPASLSAVCF